MPVHATQCTVHGADSIISEITTVNTHGVYTVVFALNPWLKPIPAGMMYKQVCVQTGMVLTGAGVVC